MVAAQSFAQSAPATGNRLHPGSLLSSDDLSLADLDQILRLATALEHMPLADRSALHRGRTVALLFYESSTRTRTSFELAAKRLGVTTTLVSDKSSSIEKGESLKDTGLTLRALGAEAIILRHRHSGAPVLLEAVTGLPILNAGDGTHEHPSQALLDLRTILARLGLTGRPISPDLLSGLTVTITGDILHSRVARSNTLLLPRLGARVQLCGPPELLPDEAAIALTPASATGSVTILRDLDTALAHTDVAMMLRIQSERLHNLALDLPTYIQQFQLNRDRLRRAGKPDLLLLHPGPMIRGLEIEGELADSSLAAIEDQVTHGLHIRTALLVRALSTRGEVGAILGEVRA